MRDPLPEDEDRRLELLFREAAAPVADDGFTDKVMRRVARRAWTRWLVLAGAGAAGLAIAWQPLWQLVGSLDALVARWPELVVYLHRPYVLAAALAVLALNAVLRTVEE